MSQRRFISVGQRAHWNIEVAFALMSETADGDVSVLDSSPVAVARPAAHARATRRAVVIEDEDDAMSSTASVDADGVRAPIAARNERILGAYRV